MVKLIVYIGNSYINIGTMRIAIAGDYIGIFDVLVIFNKILVSMYITLVIMNILLAIINIKEKNGWICEIGHNIKYIGNVIGKRVLLNGK